ncbi:MAG: glycosyltransferase family 25 protein [Nitrospira sp.]|nr:glycosyltransferase family 25 protein [Nitrospira sp.]
MSQPTSSSLESLGLDGILVLNVRSFAERRKNIERQLDPLGLQYEFIHDYDVSDLNLETLRQYFQGSTMSPAQQSCAMKHFQAHRLIVGRKWWRALILEDDVILARGFVEGVRDAITEASCLEEPSVLFIGSGGNLYTPRNLLVSGQRLYRAAKGRLAEAYIISRRVAEIRIAWIERNGIVLPADNLFERIDHEMGVVSYWLEDPVVVQGSKNGTFRSALEPAPPNCVQWIKFGLQKLRRKYLYSS